MISIHAFANTAHTYSRTYPLSFIILHRIGGHARLSVNLNLPNDNRTNDTTTNMRTLTHCWS